MIKKTISYTDYNGTERSEDFYFNLNKAELIEMKFSKHGGLENYIKDIINAKKENELIQLFKDLVLKAYGVKSEDGRRFIKNDTLKEEFMQTEAYSNLFMELATNEQAAIEFVNGIVPKQV